MCLLSFQFVLFSMVAVLLIFNPSAETTWVFAGVLAFLLACVCGYFALHVVAQFLRTSAANAEDSENEEKSGTDTPATTPVSKTSKASRARKKKSLPARFAGGTAVPNEVCSFGACCVFFCSGSGVAW